MVFKIAKCSKCNYSRWESSPKTQPGTCPKCMTVMHYFDNWYFAYYNKGRKYVQAGAPQKRVTEDMLFKTRVEIREKRFFDKIPETPWADGTANMLSWVKTNTKPATARMYENSIKALTPKFKHFTLNEIDKGDVEQYKTYRQAQGVTNATVNRDIATIKRLCSLAVDAKLLDTNKIIGAKLLPEPKGRVRFLTEAEIDGLLAQCTLPYLRMAVVIALETGLRKDGCFTLKWSDISNGSIHKSVKGDTVVHIPVTPTLERELAVYRSGLEVVSPWVIPSPDDCRTHMGVTAHKGFDAACTRAKITDFRFHDLRHTFSSHFIMRGGDLKTLQDLLGHADMKMTMRYAHVLDQHKRDQMDKFEQGRKA
jgi:integrase/recombinase XerD